jgi:hypothetical protein
VTIYEAGEWERMIGSELRRMANGEYATALTNNSFRKPSGRLTNEGGIISESGSDWERILSYKKGC